MYFRTIRQIVGEQVFQVPSPNWGIEPSTGGFTLNFSINGEDWLVYKEATPANEQLLVKNAPCGLYFKLAGNTETLELRY